MFEDTIIAISTPIGYGGLGIIRLSGKKSLPVARKIFKPKKRSTGIPARQPILGNLYDYEKKEFFEEALLTYFRMPRTYTREDMVEISCHGSPVVLEHGLRLGVKAGARHASPGEFTLRAYLNGRIDILQAEAVNDIIRASSYTQARISFSQLEGRLSRRISLFRNQIIHLLSQVEVRIEFPEEGLKISPQQISKTLESSIQSIKKLIESYDLGKTLAEGVTLAIAGRTNVGKSTLFNALLERERAIVTPYPGTTRDCLREKMVIADSIFTLIDMAGLDVPAHPVEREGIRRGKKLAEQADGVLLILDSSRKEAAEDRKLIEKFNKKKTIVLFNKIDLPVKMDIASVKRRLDSLPSLDISGLKGINLENLKQMIFERFTPVQEKGEEVILHLRQKLLLEDILSCLCRGQKLLKEGFSEEVYAEEIRQAVPLLAQLTGEIRTDDIIGEVFHRFCVGK